MTPQEQAAAVIKAATQARCLDHWSTVNDPPCHPSDPEWKGCNLCVRRAGDAAATRAQFLAIADAMEAPNNA